MKTSIDKCDVRRKAVWGPRRTLGLLLLLTFGFASSAFAASNQRNPRSNQNGNQNGNQHDKVKPGVPGRKAQHQKLDKELTFRADHRNANATTSVIVTLKPGAKLPADFKRYARPGKLNLINGHVVDLPNRLLKQLASHPDIFDVHHNRPIFKDNFRTSLAVGALAASP